MLFTTMPLFDWFHSYQVMNFKGHQLSDDNTPPAITRECLKRSISKPCMPLGVGISLRLVSRHSRANRHLRKAGEGAQVVQIIFKPDSRWKCRPVGPMEKGKSPFV